MSENEKETKTEEERKEGNLTDYRPSIESN